MWVAHGWVFMVYVVVAVLLARKAAGSLGFTILALVAGLIPLLIFWTEHQVSQGIQAENPELASLDAAYAVSTAFVLGGGGVLGAARSGCCAPCSSAASPPTWSWAPASAL